MEKQQVLEAYKKHFLENGQKPASVYAFCKSINYGEDDFYKCFNCLEAVEKEIWLEIFNNTVQQLEADDTYKNYSAKEKLLAFYFLWIQKLRENRSFVLLQKDKFKFSDLRHDTLESFRKAFIDYINKIVLLGYDSREIKERKYISDKYAYGFWLQALFVLKYWIDDSSENFEMTDAAIEKAVDLSFRLISDNTLDSLIDFGKFILTRK
ncbi:MAG TPA: TetR family transcriptional regulator C-terminal domain-containing protein [Cytophagaceae bacterium]|jgi:hypothetical protein|nr:TetR family transcriptional regulator C-terminal domain-containing protein [Cytophagaceae bacterium]